MGDRSRHENRSKGPGSTPGHSNPISYPKSRFHTEVNWTVYMLQRSSRYQRDTSVGPHVKCSLLDRMLLAEVPFYITECCFVGRIPSLRGHMFHVTDEISKS